LAYAFFLTLGAFLQQVDSDKIGIKKIPFYKNKIGGLL